MQLVLKDKLSYPVGTAPGINYAHPSAQNVLFSALPCSGNFIDYANGARRGTIVGAPASIPFGAAGPGISFLGGTDAITFSFPNTAFSVGTTAAIFEVSALNGAGAAANLIGGDTSSGNIGFGIDYFSTGFSARIGGTFINMNPVTSFLALNVPHFVVISARPSAIPTGVAVNLQTGQTWILTGNGANAATFTGTGIMRLGNRDDTNRQLNGTLYAFMRSNVFTSPADMLKWAEDPWSFWYPTLDFELFLKTGSSQFLNIPAAQGAYTLTGKVQTLTSSRFSSAVQGSYTLTGKPQTTTSARSTSAVQGVYTLTGKPQTVGLSKTLQAIQGIYSLTGKSQAFTTQLSLALTRGLYSLVGRQQTLTASNDIIILGGSRWKEGYKALVGDGHKKAAAHMSRLGGIARAKALTPTQRTTIATKAASIRWK